jgi:hypothetical protein
MGTNKAKEMKRRASQRRATHKARHTALMLAAVEARKSKPKVASKGLTKSTVKASKPKKG